jgi:hypothetical protein
MEAGQKLREDEKQEKPSQPDSDSIQTVHKDDSISKSKVETINCQ